MSAKVRLKAIAFLIRLRRPFDRSMDNSELLGLLNIAEAADCDDAADGHTPGPWNVNPVTATYRCVASADHSGERLAALAAIGHMQFDALSVGTRRGQVALIPLDESNRENARLIAAAPDLLVALRTVLAQIQSRPEAAIAFPDDDLLPIHTAIAKAEGKS